MTARTFLPNDLDAVQFHARNRDDDGVVARGVTLADGTYTLDIPSGWIALEFEHADYARAYRTRNVVLQRRASLDVSLALAPAPFQFVMPSPGDADTVLTLDSDSGRSYTRLRVEPGDLIGEGGREVEGIITARIDAAHPRDRHKDALLASDYVMQASGPPLPLRAAGIISVELHDAIGPVDVAPGQALDWEIDVAAEQRAFVRAAWENGAVHNYSLDTRTGMWVEDPAKLRFNGRTLTVARSHFSAGAVGELVTEVPEETPCPDPGRHAVVLLALSHEDTPANVAQTLATTAVEYVAQADNPRVLVVLDDDHGGAFPSDSGIVANAVAGAGYTVTSVVEPAAGLTEADVTGYDVVWLVNPDRPIDDTLTLETLQAHREAGGGFVLSGNDVAYASDRDLSDYTFLHGVGDGDTTCGSATDDGTGAQYRVSFNATSEHLLAAGLDGVSFVYGDDIDHTTPVGDGEEVLAWAELDGAADCDVRVPVVVGLDLDNSATRPVCACATDNDCYGDQHCSSNECQSCSVSAGSCSVDDDCCGELTCNGGVCGDTCANDGEACLAGGGCCGSLTCDSGLCSACIVDGGGCSDASDCCGDLACIGSACGSCLEVGDSCSADTDCCGASACGEATGQCEPPISAIGSGCSGYGTAFVGLDGVSVLLAASVTEGSTAGNVGSNGDVDVGGNSTVGGDAISTGGTVDVFGNGSANGIVEGGTPWTAEVPTDTFDAVALDNNNAAIGVAAGSPLDLNGDTLFIPSGDYAFSGVNLLAQTVITCSGTVRFYVSGEVYIGGGTQLNANAGCDLAILVGTADPVRIEGVPTIVAAIFAPLSDVRIAGSTDFEGSILARQLTLRGNAQLTASGDAWDDSGVCDPEEPPVGGTTGGEPDLPPLPDLPD